MNLAIDIGNTRTKLGFFEGETLVRKETLERLSVDEVKSRLYNHSVSACILSSVSETDPGIRELLALETDFVELTSDTPLPIGNHYATPKTLGKDRLAAAVGAWSFFPGKTCLVIDAGTCITSDVLSEDGIFKGGNISPGIDMRLKAMHTFTARLPLVGRGTTEHWIGTTTTEALQNGAQWGAIWELSALIDRCEAEFGPVEIALTGGDAEFFEKNMKRKIFANPDLVLIGLNKILTNYGVSRSK